MNTGNGRIGGTPVAMGNHISQDSAAHARNVTIVFKGWNAKGADGDGLVSSTPHPTNFTGRNITECI